MKTASKGLSLAVVLIALLALIASTNVVVGQELWEKDQIEEQVMDDYADSKITDSKLLKKGESDWDFDVWEMSLTTSDGEDKKAYYNAETGEELDVDE